jgi:hypothetical protein
MLLASALVTGILRVFLDCSGGDCHEDYLREEVELAEYVRDRADADVHVLVTRADTGAGGQEYTFTFIGLGPFQATSRTLKVTTDAGESEERIRRQLASTLTVGLLTYLAPESVPAGLEVTAQVDSSAATTGTPSTDPWRRWIFSVNGYMNLEVEQSTSENNWGVSGGADRITPEWKISIGTEYNASEDTFDLDDGEQFSAVRKDWSVNGLTVRGLGEHWSVGGTGYVRSSTFDNIESDIRIAPAVEWNFFPYSMYTRRQLRVFYSIGTSTRSYYEVTLYDKLEETLAGQELSGTYEQREPWGTLEGRAIFSNYFPGFERHRFELDGEVDIRIARGLSLNVEASVSRIRDQLSLPRRDASPEEVLLRLRQLQSDYETRLQVGLEYRFGSRFAAIVNPRFGQ